VLQEVYVRIWEKAGEFDPRQGLAVAWMATIARNRALDEGAAACAQFRSRISRWALKPAAEDIDPLAARDAPKGSRRWSTV